MYAAGLPNINGSFNSGGEYYSGHVATGAFSVTTQNNYRPDGGAYVNAPYFTFNASWSNSIYGNSTTVQPPALTLKYIIKY